MIELKMLEYAKMGALKCWEEMEKNAEIYHSNYWCDRADATEKDYHFLKDLIISKKAKFAKEFISDKILFLCECPNNSERKEWVRYFAEENIISESAEFGYLCQIENGAFDHADR